MQELFRSLGEMVGLAIRAILDVLEFVFGGFFGAVDGFIAGLTATLGISPSLLSLLFLMVGLGLLYFGIRAFLRRRLLAGVLWWLLALVVLGVLID